MKRHIWMHEDEDLICLTCGALYSTDEDDNPVSRGNGDHIPPCTGDTSMVHGARDENGHDLECAGGPDGTCEHCSHGCNCNICHG